MSEELGKDTCVLSNSDNSAEGKKNSVESRSRSNSPEETAPMATLKGKKRGREGAKASSGAAGGASSEYEVHIKTERERRKRMGNMFSSLHALLPHLPDKADKSSIVDEAVKQIETLQDTLHTLQQQKLEKLRIISNNNNSNIHMNQQPSSSMATTSQQMPAAAAFGAFSAAAQGSSSSSLNSLSTTASPRPACFRTWFSPNAVVSMCGEDAHISVCSGKKPGLLTTLCYILEKHNLDVLSAHILSDHYRSTCMIHAHASGGEFQDQTLMPVEEVFKLAVGEMNFYLTSS